MAILYFSMAVLVALEASLTSFTLLPFVSGLRWLRVHLITLGTLTEVVFSVGGAFTPVTHAERPASNA